MPKLKPGTIIPTPEEDAIITAAAMSDPDAMPLTDAEWEAAKPTMRRGRPPAAVTKQQVALRLDQEVLEAFRSGGPGWQTRINAALREWLKDHSPA